MEELNYNLPESNQPKPKKMIWVLVVVAIVVVAAGMVGWFVNRDKQPEVVMLPENKPADVQTEVIDPEKATAQGKIFLEAQADEIKKGETLTVAVYMNTGGYDISAAVAALTYDPNILEMVEKTDYEDGVLTFTMPEEKKAGWVMITCGQPGDGDWKDKDDGFNGERGLLAKVSFKVLTAGEVNIGLDEVESKLIFDDARGTAMKTSVVGVKYLVK